MSPVADLNSAVKEKELTTYISADLHSLYERAFLSTQRQTASSIQETWKETSCLEETWKQAALRTHRGYWYDPSIIRFYEDVIAELQRELARYKAIVLQLMIEREYQTEEDDLYLPGPITKLPPEIERTISGKTRPGLPLVGYEI